MSLIALNLIFYELSKNIQLIVDQTKFIQSMQNVRNVASKV